MLATLVTILVYLLIAGILVYAAQLILSLFPLPQPVKTVILLIVALVVLIWVLRLLGVSPL